MRCARVSVVQLLLSDASGAQAHRPGWWGYAGGLRFARPAAQAPAAWWRTLPILGLLLAFLLALPTAARAQALEVPQLRLDPGSHWGPVRRVAVSPDQALLATASDDKTVRVWQLEGQNLLHTLRPPVGEGDTGRLYGVAFHPQLPLLAVAGTPAPGAAALVHLFNPLTGEWMRAIEAGRGEVKRLAWSRDGQWLAVAFAAPGALRLYALQGEQTAERLLTGDAYGLDLGPDGAVAVTDTAGQLHLLRCNAEGRLDAVARVATPGREPVAVAFSPDGSRLALVHFARDRNGWVDLHAGRTGAWQASWRPRQPLLGRSQAVAWAADGNALAVGGVRSDPRAMGRDAIDSLRGFIQVYDAASGQVRSSHDVASDSVTDLVAVAGAAPVAGPGPAAAVASSAAWAFTSFDGRWGVWGATMASGNGTTPARQADYVRRADRVWLSPDARAVQWQTGADSGPRSFVLVQRLVRAAALAEARAPVTPGLLAPTREWESTPTAQPLVQGLAQPLAAGEISRAVAAIGGSDDVVWGTGHRLLRVQPGGRSAWTVRPGAEVRAVHSSADGRLVVAALADGTLRWYRAADGALLLSLLVTVDGHWVLWSPLGHYDASAGAERLIGWHVNGAPGRASEFFTIGRFRLRLLRPDVIDRVLDTADPALAQTLADRDRAAALELAQAPSPVVPVLPAVPAPPLQSVPPEAALPPLPALPQAAALDIAQKLPPTLVYKQPRAVRTRAATVALEFGVVLRPGEQLTQLLVRRDGVLQDVLEQHLPPTTDGKSGGILRIEASEGESVVHVVAANANGYSDPLTFVVRREAPPTPRQVVRTRLFVLAVGVGEHASKDINGLMLPGKDAQDFAEVLQAQDGRAYSQVQARVLTEQGATTKAILEGLEWLRASVGPGDTGMLFLAGHALNHPNGRYYFVSHDTAPRNVAASALNEEAIRAALVRLRGRAVLFVDTCHAGNAIGKGAGFSRDMTRISSQLASPENGVIVFASSTGKQESQENSEWGNGAFTKAVVTGLRGGADFMKRGRVTFQALSLFVSGEVERLTNGEQTPVLIAPPPGLPDFTLAILGATRVEGSAQNLAPLARQP